MFALILLTLNNSHVLYVLCTFFPSDICQTCAFPFISKVYKYVNRDTTQVITIGSVSFLKTCITYLKGDSGAKILMTYPATLAVIHHCLCFVGL
ncbi:hypothetical protein GDO81_008679 [Engystomops pustulosus]|uniref:Uncharacterized protein n=1 Tax=Engystomops pustulosus TaxID=76066 RepID=A0AAV7CHJ2_ENGPU|nr:hypothetical protein GDO81_008679 [Engystomops pustulosus]